MKTAILPLDFVSLRRGSSSRFILSIIVIIIGGGGSVITLFGGVALAVGVGIIIGGGEWFEDSER